MNSGNLSFYQNEEVCRKLQFKKDKSDTFFLKNTFSLAMMVHTYNLNTQEEAEAGGRWQV